MNDLNLIMVELFDGKKDCQNSTLSLNRKLPNSRALSRAAQAMSRAAQAMSNEL